MRRRDRGAVLMLVLGAVMILVILAVELAARANVDVMFAGRTAREAAYRRLSDSGAQIALGLLVEPEAMDFDHSGEPWNREVSFSLGPRESGRLRVSDESGKIHIARPGEGARLKKRLERLFEYLRKYEPGETRIWREVEAKVLLRLGLEELKEGAAPAPVEPLLTLDGLREAGLGPTQVFGPKGLARFLTCFGDGKINLNTAPPAVLYALDEEIDEALAEKIANYRGDPEGAPGVYKPFEKPRDLELVDGIVERSFVDGQPRVVRNLYSKIQAAVTTRSRCFSVHVEARVDERVRHSWAFFEPKRVERAGEGGRRELRRLAYEEVLP